MPVYRDYYFRSKARHRFEKKHNKRQLKMDFDDDDV